MSRAVLLTGGNLGDIRANIAAVRADIAARIGEITAASAVYESRAWGFEAEEMFLNQVLVVETALSPEELLGTAQEIEKMYGRERKTGTGYSSRTMDIDILYYDTLLTDSALLSVPHPRIAEREFVLRPLAEVVPTMCDPRTGLTPVEMLNKLRNNEI